MLFVLMPSRLLLLLVLLAAGPVVAGDARRELDSGVQGVMLGRSMQYLVDTDGNLGIDNVVNLGTVVSGDGEAGQPRWQPLDDEIANFGLTPAVYWFRLPLRVVDTAPAWLLEISYSLLDQVDFYLEDDSLVSADNGGDAQQSSLWRQRAGLGLPQQVRVMPHRLLLFPLPPLGAGDYTIYLRLQSFHAVQVPVALWQVDDYLWRDELHNLVVGLLAGAMLVMLVYNLLLYSVVRDAVYLLYTGVVVSVLLLQFGMQGVGVRHFWPNSLSFAEHSVVFGGLTSTYFCAGFTVSFLQLKERGHFLYVPYFWVGQISLAAALLSLLVSAVIMVPVMVLCALSGGVLASLILGNVWRSHERPTLIFALGWSVLIVGVLLLALNKLGLLPMNFFTEQMISAGILIQLVLFSMALGDRINFDKQQTLIAQRATLATLVREHEANTRALHNEEQTRLAREKTLRLQTQSNAELERDIETRTRELAAATEQLREISRCDALTGLYNRREFNERLNTEYGRAARAGIALSLVLLDIDHFKSINDSYGHLAGDECLQFFAALLRDTVSREAAIVCRYGGEEFALLLPGYTVAGALVLAERIRTQLAVSTIQSQGHSLCITVSAGIAGLLPIPAVQAKPVRELVDQADRALYQAKTDGRNCVRCAAGDADDDA